MNSEMKILALSQLRDIAQKTGNLEDLELYKSCIDRVSMTRQNYLILRKVVL